MKLFATTLLTLLVLQFVQAKDISKSLPEKISTYMQNNYPNATEVEWIKTNSSNYISNVYQAHFYNDSLLVTIEITPEGLVLAKETELAAKDIPAELLYFIQGHKLKFAAIIEYNDEKPVYLLETRYKKQDDFRIFTSKGSVLHVKKHFLFL